MTTLVWYAAYGSNLRWERFRCYLHGGMPAGAVKGAPGARTRADPLDEAAATIDLPLRFTGRSPTWGGGVAVARPPRSSSARTLARLYLLTLDQFEDVAAQEAHVGRVALDLRQVSRHGVVSLTPGPYGTVVLCGVRGGAPVLTVAEEPGALPPNSVPTAAYLRVVARGLVETHGCDAPTIGNYLMGLPGVAPAWGSAALGRLVRDVVAT